MKKDNFLANGGIITLFRRRQLQPRNRIKPVVKVSLPDPVLSETIEPIVSTPMIEILEEKIDLPKSSGLESPLSDMIIHSDAISLTKGDQIDVQEQKPERVEPTPIKRRRRKKSDQSS